MAPEIEILLLNKQEVISLLDLDEVFLTVELVFRWIGNKDIFMSYNNALWLDDNHDNMFNSQPSYIPKYRIAGMKWFNMFTKQQLGFPTMFGHIITLNNTENGAPIAILEGTAITNMRTASGHGTVAASYLARPDSAKLAIVGCGSQGRFGIQGIARRFPLRQIFLFDLYAPAMETFEKDMRASGYDFDYVLCDSAAQAASKADIILMATSAKEPLVCSADIPEGCTVIGLYSFNDLHPDIAGLFDKWILGNSAIDERNILESSMLKARGITLPKDKVYGDLSEIICGKKTGRDNRSQRIVYTHMGMGGFDIALARVVYEKALKNGIGTKFKLQ